MKQASAESGDLDMVSKPAHLRRKPRAKPSAPPIEATEPVDMTPVPYDENLLERARTQWQFGDWESLAKIERDTLQHHPERAKLALLTAAGRLQTGEGGEAKQYIRLAQDWGISKKLISQILIAGVHNSISRAAAVGNQPHRALQHFESAITVGTPGSDAKLLTQARAGEQLSQLGLPTSVGYLKVSAGKTEPMSAKLPPLSKSIETLNETLCQQKTELDAQFKKQGDELTNLRKQLQKTVKQEMLNAPKQLEAFLDIQNFFKHGEHLPAMHGWPVSPDFAHYLIQLLEKNDYDLILEFGSGTSTVIMARTLAHLDRTRQGKPAALQIAFEHLEKYHHQTRADLEGAGLAQSVELTLAPLQPYHPPNGNTYSYYTCHEKLADIATRLPVTSIKILLVVDGPPASTGQHARYPALPAVLAHLNGKVIDILLDDYARQDEKEVGALWEKDFEQLGYNLLSEKISMEKEALFISASPQ